MFSRIKWRDGGLELGPFRFIEEVGDKIGIVEADYPMFVIMNNRDIINSYPKAIDKRNQYNDILEIGIMKGGGGVFFNELLQPKRHLAIDVCEQKSGIAEFAKQRTSRKRAIAFLPAFPNPVRRHCLIPLVIV